MNNDATLIIGAGAHKPYGFPTSEDLRVIFQSMHPEYSITEDNKKNAILSDLKHKLTKRYSSVVFSLKTLSKNNENINLPWLSFGSILEEEIDIMLTDFIDDFFKSQVSSIDQFISKRIEDGNQKQVLVGKLLTTLIIDEYEQKHEMTLDRNDWIQSFIADCLAKRIDEFKNSPPNIITFNYDTFFEKCIMKHLVALYKFTKNDALKFIEDLNIIHVYGKIDSLTNILYDKESLYTFEHIPRIEQSLNGLQVVGETTSEKKNKIRRVIRSSTLVCFLGFGFNEQNVELLLGQSDTFDPQKYEYFIRERGYNTTKKIKFISTNIGLGDYKIQEIKRKYQGLNIDFFGGEQKEPVDSLKLIKEKIPSFFHGSGVRALNI